MKTKTFGLLVLLCLISLLLFRVMTYSWSNDLDYLVRGFPGYYDADDDADADEAAALWCPNIPYYGGLSALYGREALQCFIRAREVQQLFVEDGDGDEKDDVPVYGPIDSTIDKPILLSWNQGGLPDDGQMTSRCPRSQCYLTSNRNYTQTNLPMAIIFYGTNFKLTDLPVPRKPEDLWVLTHEESPKNEALFSYGDIMKQFNITSTFRSESHFPIGTQYLGSIDQLLSKKFYKTIEQKNRYRKEGLAPIVYIQSDCGTPSDRDHLVKWMMGRMDIDSYGECLHNKDLPKHLQDPVDGMSHPQFTELVSRYKFVIAFENGICKDYVTEKFWRPLIIGSVPVVLGAPNIQRDYAPSEKSILAVDDFKSVSELVEKIKYLDGNDEAYQEYLEWKSEGVLNSRLVETMKNRVWDTDFDVEGMNTGSTHKGNYISHLECLVCNKLSGKLNQKERKTLAKPVDKSHYGCPLPLEYTDPNDLTKRQPFTSGYWNSYWINKWCDIQAWLKLRNNESQVTRQQLQKKSGECLVDKLHEGADLEYVHELK